MMMQLEEFTIAPRSRIITYLWGLRDAQNLIDIAMKKNTFLGRPPKCSTICWMASNVCSLLCAHCFGMRDK